MELWVRSQTKEQLIKVNNIEIFHHYSYKDTQEKYLLPSGSFECRNVQKKDKYIKSVIACNDEITLGTYKSKERALEILDEIQNILNPRLFVNVKPSEEMIGLLGGLQHGKTLKMKNDFEYKELSTYVYEMPEE
jgi:hypothetical protein